MLLGQRTLSLTTLRWDGKTKKCRKETSDLSLVLVHLRDGNNNAIGLLSKTTSSHVHHAFLYISLPLMHDYEVKMPSFTFYGGRHQARTNFSFNSREIGLL